LLAAGNIYLSLQDAIALALENNIDIQIQRYTRPQAQASLLRAQAGGPLRGVTSSIQTQTTSALSQLTGGASNVFSSGGGGSSTSSTSTGGILVTSTGTTVPSLDPAMYFQGYWGHNTSLQPNNITVGQTAVIFRNDSYATGFTKSFLTGTSVQLGWNAQEVQSNIGSFYQPANPYTSGSLGLQFQQHLLQGFGLAANNRFIRVAKNSIKLSDYTFRQQVIYTVSQIVGAYWDLVSYIENVKVKQQALQVAQRLYEDNKKQVEIGTLAPIEIVKAESEVATYQQQLVNAETQVLQQETLLKNALSKTGVASPSVADAHIIPTDHIAIPQIEPAIPIQDLMAKALENRPEIIQSQISIDSSKIQMAGSKSELLPTLDVFASLQNNALVGQPNTIAAFGPGGLPGAPIDPFYLGSTGRLMTQLFSRNFPNYTAGFQLNIPFRNRAAQADYILDSLNLRQQELQYQRLINSIRVDVRNALIAVQQAAASYQASVKARELAQQTLDAEQKKYSLGASTIFFVIQYQRDLATAQATEVTAQSQYAKAKVQLDVATGDTLDRYNVALDEAMKGRVSRAPSAVPVAKP
jgi:outer membrane protein TolC